MFACLAWLLAVEVLPALHLAHHHAGHTHDATGAILAIAHHGDHDHVVFARTATRTPLRHSTAPRSLAIDHPVDSGHQAAGVAHHAVAWLTPVLPALPIAPDAIAWSSPAPVAGRSISFTGDTVARGPPRCS